MKTYKLTIKGNVQGVGFRYFAKKRADLLGITGWIRNEDDGTVSSVVCGNEKDINDFIAWCHEGSPAAEVSSVDIGKKEIECKFSEFTIS